MGNPVFGISVRRVDNEARPVLGADLSTVGLIGPAPDADATAFPINTPVLLYSNDYAKLKLLGEGGYLKDAIRGVNDQLAETQFAARVIVVRTAPGTNVDPAIKTQQTINNIVGDSTAGTGLWAFVKSAAVTGATPRLIGAPGYTGQMANTVNVLTPGVAGVGYTEGETYDVTFSGGGANAVQATGYATGLANGSVAVTIVTPGAWYTTPPTVTIEAPGGSGGTTATFTATIASGANPVCASAPAMLNRLYAHMVVESSGTSQANDNDWRETINSGRLIPVSGTVKVMDPVSSNIVYRPSAGRILGLGVRRDHEKGAPFHSWANQPVYGIVAPGREIGFVLTDDANEGQDLLKDNIGIITRGEIGDDFAIASGGFIFIGTDNADEDPIWQMYNVSRGRDYIHLGIIKTERLFLGRFNIVGQTVQAIVDTVDFFLRDLEADGHILGRKVYFKGAQNTASEVRQGHLVVGFLAEEAPVLKRITNESGRYAPAIDRMVRRLEAQLNIAA